MIRRTISGEDCSIYEDFNPKKREIEMFLNRENHREEEGKESREAERNDEVANMARPVL